MSVLRLLIATLILGTAVMAQSVSPVIVEYKGSGEGKVALTNNTQGPLAVTLEPRSFSITPEGKGKYRALDPDIHLELSTNSVRLQPGQTYYVFYKVKSDKVPAWFTLFSAFTAPRQAKGVEVKIMLPHTVYLYQKEHLQKPNVEIKAATYDSAHHKIVCDLINNSQRLGRVQLVRASGHGEATMGGFPLLPGSPRHIELDWKSDSAPKEISFTFEHFTLNQPLPASVQSSQ